MKSIFTPERFKEIACHKYNICKCSFLNRLIIFMQNRYCTELKSSDYWNMLGREIINNAIPVYILGDTEDIKYIDCSSNQEIKTSDLTIDEIDKAISLGVIKKTVKSTEVSEIKLYDVKDTVYSGEKSGNDEFNRCKKMSKLKISTLYKYAELTGISLETNKDIKTTFDKKTNTLICGKEFGVDKLNACIEALSEACIYIAEKAYLLDNEELGLLHEYFRYGIYSHFGLNAKVDFSNIEVVYANRIREDSIENLICAFEIVENSLSEIFALNDNQADFDNNLIKRAEMLLNILEANYSTRKLRGN